MPRVVAALGVVILLVCGGAGAAVASGGFSWLPWAENPDVTHAFSLPSGRGCEERIVLQRSWYGGDWDGFVNSVRHLTVSDRKVDEVVSAIRGGNAAVLIVSDAGELVSPAQAGRTAADATDDDWFAQAHKIALGYELNELAQRAGLGDNWSSDFQIQCEAVAP